MEPEREDQNGGDRPPARPGSPGLAQPWAADGGTTASDFIGAVRSTSDLRSLAELMEAVTTELGFDHYALIHHEDIRTPRESRVDLKRYPASATERIFDKGRFRRDPVIRACQFAGSAFLWTELDSIIELDRYDRERLRAGARDGLNIGITVPCVLLGDPIGSCTFAGSRQAERAGRSFGAAQVVGVFAFQAARRLTGCSRQPAAPPRLHPRPRDCVVLAGRGQSNKEIARALGLRPRTVDGYMTEARELFQAHGRTELVVSAVLAGEVGLDELRRRQPE